MTEKRTPKVGEVWTAGVDAKGNRMIEAIVGGNVYYTTPQGTPIGMKINTFMDVFDPPKPKPIDIWINHYPNGDYYLHTSEEGALEGKGGSNDTEYTNKIKTVHYREVLEE